MPSRYEYARIPQNSNDHVVYLSVSVCFAIAYCKHASQAWGIVLAHGSTPSLDPNSASIGIHISIRAGQRPVKTGDHAPPDQHPRNTATVPGANEAKKSY